MLHSLQPPQRKAFSFLPASPQLINLPETGIKNPLLAIAQMACEDRHPQLQVPAWHRNAFWFAFPSEHFKVFRELGSYYAYLKNAKKKLPTPTSPRLLWLEKPPQLGGPGMLFCVCSVLSELSRQTKSALEMRARWNCSWALQFASLPPVSSSDSPGKSCLWLLYLSHSRKWICWSTVQQAASKAKYSLFSQCKDSLQEHPATDKGVKPGEPHENGDNQRTSWIGSDSEGPPSLPPATTQDYSKCKP